MSDSGYTVNEVTDASLRQSFMYAQLAVRGLDTNMIGTPLTVELSKAFDAYFAAHDAEVARQTLLDAAKVALNDMAEARTRGRLWHEWLCRRANQIGENK